MALYICLLNNCTRSRGNPSLRTSKRANRGHSDQDHALELGQLGLWIGLKHGAKPSWSFLASHCLLSSGGDMWLHERCDTQRHMKRNALVSLADVISINDVTGVGNDFHLHFLCLPRGLCWLSDLAVTTDGVDRLFPIANKQVCHLKTNPSWLFCWRYLWWQKGFCELALSSSGQCQLGLLKQIEWPCLNWVRECSRKYCHWQEVWEQ